MFLSRSCGKGKRTQSEMVDQSEMGARAQRSAVAGKHGGGPRRLLSTRTLHTRIRGHLAGLVYLSFPKNVPAIPSTFSPAILDFKTLSTLSTVALLTAGMRAEAKNSELPLQ